MRQADAYVEDKKRALIAVADNEKSLRAECERMVKENDKLRYLQSQNVIIHREVTTKLDEDLQSMTAVRNELDDQLRASKYQNRLDREKFERLLQIANQCKVAVQKEEENESFSYRDAYKFSDPRNKDKSRTSRTDLQIHIYSYRISQFIYRHGSYIYLQVWVVHIYLQAWVMHIYLQAWVMYIYLQSWVMHIYFRNGSCTFTYRHGSCTFTYKIGSHTFTGMGHVHLQAWVMV